jgi:predicted nucleotidyltransferase
VRLSEQEIEQIKQAAQQVFGPAVRVALFGSRLDDRGRGGDIDLFVEVPTQRSSAGDELAFRVALERTLGQRKVDVVLHGFSEPLTPFEAQAQAQAVPL